MSFSSSVGGSLHDPGGFRQEQPHRYLHRLLRCRSWSGVGFLVALVRLGPPTHTHTLSSFSLNVILTIHFLLFQVNAARRRRRLPSAKPRVQRTRSPLLLLLRLLHQVRLRGLSGHFHAQLRVSGPSFDQLVSLAVCGGMVDRAMWPIKISVN